MKLTIIPSDGAVYKDGVSFSKLDLSCAPQDVHALQWLDTKGWVEFVVDAEFNKPANETITELPAWANDALALWDAANVAAQGEQT